MVKHYNEDTKDTKLAGMLLCFHILARAKRVRGVGMCAFGGNICRMETHKNIIHAQIRIRRDELGRIQLFYLLLI